ncbi:DUF4160 domain-containing protein [Odoribacter sp. OttesenSCG-928-L07]|nr:DUF4160 domain-containing protein [Odoribacter sp. OttesenSCG-928-L07]
MSPTIFAYKRYRFFFNSREEKRKHVHVETVDGTAKFWIEPIVSLADYYNLSTKELKIILKIIEEKQNEIIYAWNKHFN